MGNKSKHDYGRGDNVKELFKNAISNYAKENLKRSIPDEKIEQAFAIIDTHTRLLDNMTMINNYNMSIQVISSVLMTQPNWSDNEEHCKELINEYFNIFMDLSQIPEEDIDAELKELRNTIKDYVISSCMIYYSVAHKDQDLLKKYNKEVAEAIRNILKIIYKRDQRNQPNITASITDEDGNTISSTDNIINISGSGSNAEV